MSMDGATIIGILVVIFLMFYSIYLLKEIINDYIKAKRKK